MTEGLKKILHEWLEWAENGAGEHDVFGRYFALCIVTLFVDETLHDELKSILLKQFGENMAFPFGGMDKYFVEKANGTMHLNPELLAWVRKQLGDV